MRSFKDVYENNLHESLNTPIQFYLTDDTKLPKRIAATFKIDETEYGMSLEESQFKHTYILKFYRIANKIGRLWKFSHKSHILPCLSTLLKFLESATPFMQGKFDAILVSYNKKHASAKRIEKFVERMVRKTYIQDFRYVPVEGNINNKTYAYAFIVNKKKSPNQIFTTKTFKGIEFDPKAGSVPSEAAEQLYSTAPPKGLISTKPSKKYKLGSQEFGLDYEPEYNAATKKALEVKPLEVADTPEKEKKEDEKPLELEDTDGYKAYESMIANSESTHMLLIGISQFESMLGALQKYGYDEKKIHNDNLKYVMNQAKEHNPAWFKVAYKHGLYTMGGEPKLNNMKKAMKEYAARYKKSMAADSSGYSLSTINSYMYSSLNALEKSHQEIEKSKTKPKSTDQEIKTVLGDADISALVSGVKGQKGAPIIDSDFDMIFDSDTYDVVKYLSVELGYSDKLTKHKNFGQLKSYTGSNYSYFNTPLRNFGTAIKNNDKWTINALSKKIYSGHNRISKLWSIFEDIEPLPVPMWVFRNSQIQPDFYDVKPGDEFLDPAFLSTSLRSTMSLGGPDKSAIYLPKGTPVLPVLDDSSHPSEQEIVLAPMSIQKVLRVDSKINSYNGKPNFKMITMYTGTAMPELKKFAKQSTNMAEILYNIRQGELMTEDKKKEYNPEEKFGSKISKDNKELVNKIKEYVKKNKKK